MSAGQGRRRLSARNMRGGDILPQPAMPLIDVAEGVLSARVNYVRPCGRRQPTGVCVSGRSLHTGRPRQVRTTLRRFLGYPQTQMDLWSTRAIWRCPARTFRRYPAGMTTIRLQSNPEAEVIVADLNFGSVYESFVARLQRLNVKKAAPRVDEAFPNFSLPDAAGRYRSIQQLQDGRPLVISFIRGRWCPFCVHELQCWAASSPALEKVGGRLVLVAGEIGEGASAIQEIVGPSATLLCDVDHGAALACGLAFPVGEEIKRRYLGIGIDLAAIYGSDGGFLPIPATFVVGEEGNIRYAHVDPDFRLRPEPVDIVEFVAAMR